jgi:peptidoglycan hydrolase-like protein with peptidoglycan-binding domain
MQTLLNQYGEANPPLKETRVFGPKTLAVVRSFQRASSLSVDGTVGLQTWVKLVAASTRTQASSGKPDFSAPKRELAAEAAFSALS